jgi:hypothetical protein
MQSKPMGSDEDRSGGRTRARCRSLSLIFLLAVDRAPSSTQAEGDPASKIGSLTDALFGVVGNNATST